MLTSDKASLCWCVRASTAAGPRWRFDGSTSTTKARRVLRQASQAAKRAEDEFLAPIPAPDRRRLKELLQAVISP
jgi:hypothetical protein